MTTLAAVLLELAGRVLSLVERAVNKPRIRPGDPSPAEIDRLLQRAKDLKPQ